MRRRCRSLVTLLLVLLLIGILPMQAGAGLMRTCGEADGDSTCCCVPEVFSEATCCPSVREPVQNGCPCKLESRTDDRVQFPPPTSGAPTVPAVDLATELPNGALSASVDPSLPVRVEAKGERDRAGPPLFRLFAVDRR